jgi:hypothetical protein
MIKKKAKGKTVVKKAAKKRSAPRKKERNPAGVRNDIAKLVESGAKRITKAVMDQAMTGQLAPAKYLFEMAEIYPQATDGSYSTVDEESLAATLLRRLDMPDEPIPRDEEDAPQAGAAAEKPAVKLVEEDEAHTPVAEPVTAEENEEMELASV